MSLLSFSFKRKYIMKVQFSSLNTLLIQPESFAEQKALSVWSEEFEREDAFYIIDSFNPSAKDSDNENS